MTVHTFNERDVCLLLAGSPPELAEGLRLVDQEYRFKLSAWVRGRFPGLTANELAECWAGCLSSLHQTICNRGFDSDLPLRPFICSILRRRAIDTLRRKTDNTEALEQIGYALRDTNIGAKWRVLGEAQRAEISQHICNAAAALPEKQRIVLQAYSDGHPRTDEDIHELVRLVSERTGQAETLVAVKGSLREGLKKMRDQLRRSGYGLDSN